MRTIVLASTSALKIEACRRAFPGDTIIPVKSSSGINEQPLGDETLQGARNRLRHAREQFPDASYFVSIENGIFEEDARYVDRAVVTVESAAGQVQVTLSDGVEFPGASVEEARSRGFETWTVGRVMQEQGVVKQHDDPHLDLSGRSRVEYIDEAVRRAAGSLP